MACRGRERLDPIDLGRGIVERQRKRRLTQQETHELLLEEGVRSLHGEGVGVGLDAVNLETAIRSTGVARASAYRLWQATDDHGPQDLFQREVLQRAIGARDAAISRTIEVVTEVITSLGEQATPQELYRAMIRPGAQTNLEGIRSSPEWRIVIALHSLVSARPDHARDPELVTMLDTAEAEWRERIENDFYRPLQDLLGLTPRPAFGDDAIQLVILSANALAEGLISKDALTGPSSYVDRTWALEDGTEWGLFALVFEAIVPIFFETPWDNTRTTSA